MGEIGEHSLVYDQRRKPFWVSGKEERRKGAIGSREMIALEPKKGVETDEREEEAKGGFLEIRSEKKRLLMDPNR